MGALSAIIVGPCVAAPLAGALLYIGQTHDALLGGTALFSMALGMGVPLLLIGASAGTLLPKAGGWMESVKHFFGVLLLAVAIWLISSLIPVSVQMLLWAVLLILSAIYLHALDALQHNAGNWHKLVERHRHPGPAGRDRLSDRGAVRRARHFAPAGGVGQRPGGNTKVAAIRAGEEPRRTGCPCREAGGKTVMLDFYADWCVSCKEMERNTFSDARVQAKLKNALLLQADVTDNSGDDKALLARYQLFGPPAILFYDKQGKEQADFRVTGYQEPVQFLQSLQGAV